MSTIKNNNTNIYYGTDTVMYPIMATLSAGTTVTAIGKDYGYTYTLIEFGTSPNKMRGYVSTASLNLTETISTLGSLFNPMFVVSSLTLYTGPTASANTYGVAGSVSKNEKVVQMFTEGSYSMVEYYTDEANNKRKRAYIQTSKLTQAPLDYTPSWDTASNGVKLRYIRTTPDNVKPCFFSSPISVPKSGIYGINGGFFNMADPTQLVSLSMVNNSSVNPNAAPTGYYGSGFVNGEDDRTGNIVLVPRGTMIYDPRQTNKVRVDTIGSYTEISPALSTGCWAQGGMNMFRSYETNNENTWYNNLSPEKPNGASGSSAAYRTGMVYNPSTNMLYLVISENTCNFWNFRKAIIEIIFNNNLINNTVKGVFLDGGGSTEMSYNRYSNYGSYSTPRAIAQMLKVLN